MIYVIIFMKQLITLIKSVINNQKDKWIILIHPMGGTERIFEKQIPLLMVRRNNFISK